MKTLHQYDSGNGGDKKLSEFNIFEMYSYFNQ